MCQDVRQVLKVVGRSGNPLSVCGLVPPAGPLSPAEGVEPSGRKLVDGRSVQNRVLECRIHDSSQSELAGCHLVVSLTIRSPIVHTTSVVVV